MNDLIACQLAWRPTAIYIFVMYGSIAGFDSELLLRPSVSSVFLTYTALLTSRSKIVAREQRIITFATISGSGSQVLMV